MDVTQKKEAEELFRLATEASPSGTLLVDETGRILLVNAHIEELFGYLREELVGQQIDVLVPESVWSAHPGERERLLADLQSHELGMGWELFGRRKDGSEFPVEVGLNPIETPQGLRVLASVVDISARKAAEEEGRQRREQVERLSRASLLGEMTASLAHELNQPLAAIMSNASAGMRFIEKGDVDLEQLREILGDVGSASRRAHQIVQGVRNAIKKGSALYGRVDLNQVVTNVTHMIQSEAVAQFCTVETALADDLPTVEGDPGQLQQVVINLVSNALHAVREVPRERRKVSVSTQCNGNGLVAVTVRDYGSGITAAARDHLFEQFFTTREEGLGHGPADRALDRRGAWRQDRGPERRRGRRTIPLRNSRHQGGGEMIPPESMVFVIDDDAAVRKGLKRLFTAADYASEVFASAAEFLARAAHPGPSCVIVDVQMPGLNGIDLQETLLQLRREEPLIFITGHGDIPMCARAMKAGAVDFLQKPFQPKELLLCVERALRRSEEQRRRAAQKRESRALLDCLTPRQFEVMQLLVTGMLNKQIGGQLGMAEKTVKVHRGLIMRKLGITSVAELVRVVEKAEVPSPSEDGTKVA